MRSRIYFGKVSHSRHQPVSHRFNYRTFMMYLDLDELPTLFQKFWFWSVNRRNLAEFRDKDYMNEEGGIKATVIEEIRKQTGYNFKGRIALLTHMRYFGYCFNPVSFYYCYNESDELQFIVSQINNTPWDERYCYVMDNRNAALKNARGELQCQFEKDFHVSPFLDMEFQYDWRFSEPGEKLLVNMNNFKNGERWFNANLQLQAEPITSKSLLKGLLGYPLMTLKVTTAIYWQALKLWAKGAVFYDHPNPEDGRTIKQ